MTPVAIVGMAALFPGAPDLATYWHNLVNGVDAISSVPADRWDAEYYEPSARRADRIYCRRGGFVDAEVDAARFGIMPNSVRDAEPDQLIALRVAAEAIADAGGEDRLPEDRQRVGVILGRGGYLTPGLVRLDQRVRAANQLVKTLGELLPDLDPARLDDVRAAFTDQLGPEAPESAIGLVPNLAASRLANRLDLRGPAYTVDAACASSLVAIDHAVQELSTGRCDVVLAGGVHHCHDITIWSVFSQLGALSPSEQIRPFHKDADGVLIGEGTGVVVLKRLEDAERDGDRVYAVIRGTGVASDGRTASLLNPDSGGQARAVRQAWAAAGLDPAEPGSIGLLEAHGTATPAGDAAELNTVAEVFGPTDGQRAVIGSVKSNVGHLMPAAGVAGLIKAALAVHHGVLPPTLHCDEPHPALAQTRFETLSTARPWQAPVRRAAVNAFGFGGINAHVVLEQAASRVSVWEPERELRLAAANPSELAALLDRPDAELLALPGSNGPTRLGIVDPTEKRVATARRAVAKGRAWRGRNDIWFAPQPLGGKVAFVFPGLEGEFEPRADDIARHFGLRWSSPAAQVGDVGRHGTGVLELGRLLDGALRRLGVSPDGLAGHSVGEWTAMGCGGIHAADDVDAFLDTFDPDALRVPGVAFAVIGTAADVVLQELAGRSDVVLSHDNAPNQSLICGPQDAVDELVERFRARAVISQVLPFRSGFHTPMLAPYLGPIRAAADEFELHPQQVPVWSATTASVYPSAAKDVRELFVRHLLEPVRFRPMIEAMYADGYRTFLQLGAGQLGSLIGDTLHGREHLVVAAQSPHRSGLAQLQRVQTALWAESLQTSSGVPLNLGGALVSLDKRPRLSTGVNTLQSLSSSSPIAAELSALIQETTDLATQLLTSSKTPDVWKVSVDTMPYLLDHCFFEQRPDWPDDGDRWPVVPGTTVIDYLMGVAEQTTTGAKAVAVHDVRLSKWITAVPAIAVPIDVQPQGPSRVAVALGDYSRAVVQLATAYANPPEVWRFDRERKPGLTAAELYSERWMFHGPQFQGVSELTAIGDRHVRALLTTPAAPGALLDNVGQVLGYWIMSELPDRTTVFPVGMDSITFYGPHPPPGRQLECLVKITAVSDTALEADMQLVLDNQVWAEFHGWRDRRFDSNPRIRATDRRPGRELLSDPQPGGWSIVHEQWPDLATRELIMRNQLGSSERAQYADRPPAGRRQWLLGRIAAKDAVRRHLWRTVDGEIYPAEIEIRNQPSGMPYAVGIHGRELPALTVSIAHRGETGVAIVRDRPCGIDIEEIAERPASTYTVACGPAELELMGEPTPIRFARFWTAKEAVAKLLGTGLRGAPQRFEVIEMYDDRLVVQVDGQQYDVRTAQVPGPDSREYIVAWTSEDR
ncbi:polyketide synthase dehydratase domain-containing protein [Kribbella sp. NBC_00482]|uniref:type I polyketide synthase n=1 Tax=Kribbella sp. NBC_00482 TaxID=2975968 RepID=UPI002E19D036